MPVWLQSVEEIRADPSIVSERRLDELRAGKLPYGLEERRFVRNRAVIKQITADLSRNEVSAAGNNGEPVASDTPASLSLSGNSTHASHNVFRTTALPSVLEAHRPPLVIPSADEAKSASNSVTCKSHPADSETEQAEKLKKTVLAPLYQRMQADSDVITRLRQETVILTTDVEKHKSEIVRLQQEMEQSSGLKKSKSDEAATETDSRGRKRRRSTSPPSPMQLGDVANGNNEYTTEGHLTHLANKISRDLDEPVPNETIQLCGLATLRIMLQRPDDVLELAHQKLHTWPYKHVPACWRRMYEDASLSKAVQILRDQAQEIGDWPKKKQRLDERKISHSTKG